MNAVIKNNDINIGIYSAKHGNHLTFSRIFKNIDIKIRKHIKVLKNLNNLNDIDYLIIDEGQRLRKKYSFSAP